MGLRSGGELHDEEFLGPPSTDVFVTGPAVHGAIPIATGVHAFDSPASSIPAGVKLPPGFETMFNNTVPTTARLSSPPTGVSMSPPLGLSHTSPVLSSIPNPASPNSHMFNAVLDTLGKLNKHLDAASANGAPDPRSSPVISALMQAASESSSNRFPLNTPHLQQSAYSVDIDRIKEELH